MTIKKRFAVLSALAAIFLTSQAHAINVENFRPYFPGSRTATSIESKPKPQDTLVFDFGFDYALRPFEFGNSAGNGRVRGAVDHLFTFDLGAGYSITDRVAAAVNFPFHITNGIKSLTNLSQQTVVSVGDLLFSGLFTILDRDDSSAGFGLAVAPFISLPTGANGNFVGDNVNGGFWLISDVDLGGHYIAANLGLRLRKEENLLNLKVGQELMYKLAYRHFVSESLGLDGFTEASGSIVINGVHDNSSPLELGLGLAKTISDETPLTVKIGSSLGVTHGYGTPDYRAFLALSYDYQLPERPKKTVVEVEEPVTIEKVETRLKELTIYYPTNGAQVDPFYDQKIAGIAQILQENPNLGTLYIIGHTDDVGGDDFNKRLSDRRAKQALQSLLDNGVNQDRVVAYGLGESSPAAPNTTADNKALNRRTVFSFSKERAEGRSGYSTNAQAYGSSDNSDSYTEKLKTGDSDSSYYKEDQVVKKVRVMKKRKKIIQEPARKRGAASETDLSDPSTDDQSSDGAKFPDEDNSDNAN